MINFRIIRNLWLFLAVAEERHFGNAAKRLCMSQPPLTKQIQILEHALKVKLFDRSRAGVQLTAAGVAILPAVHKFAQQVQRLEVSVREAIMGHNAMRTVGTIETAMSDVLPAVIASLRADFPAIKLALKETNTAGAISALETGDIDVAFVRLDRDYGPVTALALKTDKLVVALPANHRLASRKTLRLAEIADEDFVLFPRAISPAYFDNVVNACGTAGFSPRILHEAQSASSQLAFVACGQGVAIIPSALETMNTPGVKFMPIRDVVDVVTMSVAWNKHRPNPAVDAVVAAAQRWAQS